jgi:predicted membrane protein DUF2157
MNPDVAAAVLLLRADGTLAAAPAERCGRVARGQLVSVRAELRLLHYGGVLLVMAGVGLLVRENLERIGPLTIAIALWAAAAGALFWAWRHRAPFSWGEAPSPHLAFDYILLLGVLLTGAALAYVEVQFTPLGENWRHHLLLMAVVAATLAVRGDSKLVAAVALTTLAAWRGVSASPLERAFWSGLEAEGALRANAVVTGLAFLALAWALVRFQRKAHFEPVATYLGWILALGALVSGIGAGEDEGEGAYRVALLLVGGALAAMALRRRRFPLFGLGVAAAYVGLSALVVPSLHDGVLVFLYFTVTGIAVLAGLLLAHRALRESA